MKHLIVIFMVLLALISTSEARPRQHTHHKASHRSQVADNGRPAECYGIPWCGCWLRIRKGITDKSANLAAWWRHWGTHVSGPRIGAVAFMYRKGGSGHVGEVVGVDDKGNPIIISGNHNHAVATATYPKQRIAEYRM